VGQRCGEGAPPSLADGRIVVAAQALFIYIYIQHYNTLKYNIIYIQHYNIQYIHDMQLGVVDP
jgi:hypothetical protein